MCGNDRINKYLVLDNQFYVVTNGSAGWEQLDKLEEALGYFTVAGVWWWVLISNLGKDIAWKDSLWLTTFRKSRSIYLFLKIHLSS